MTTAKRQQLARELDTLVRYLRLTGLDDTALVAAMSGRVADFQALMNAAWPGGMTASPNACRTCATTPPWSPSLPPRPATARPRCQSWQRRQ